MIWLLLGEMVAAPLGRAEEPLRIESVQVYPTPTGSRIVIQASQPMAVLAYTLQDPDRLIVDPIETALQTTISPSHMIAGGVLTGWQIVVRDGAVDYLVFPAVLPVRATVYQADRLVTVEVTAALPESRAPTPPSTLAAPPPRLLAVRPPPVLLPPPVAGQRAVVPPPSAGAAGPTVVAVAPPAPPGPLHPTAAIEQALAVYEPARIALEEAEVAMLKVKEARRNLFPGASVRGSYSRGTATGAAFRETQIGLQVEHPLYDAGRLRDAYRQSMVNLQVTQKRYEKVRADFAFEVAQAYFELMAARRGAALRDRLLQEIRPLADVTTRRYDAGLLTRMEFLNVQSQVSQAQFQSAGAQNDVVIAELKFRHRMRWDETTAIPLPGEFPEAIPRAQLPEALTVAATSRPDIQINALLVQFQKYEEQLAKKKGAWKLDLTGFAGQSAGAFETESLNLKNDYSLALKVSKPWGGNASAMTFTKVRTSPRVGQTTRTESSSVQGEIGLLNALAGKTEVQQATVGRLKAEEDLAETRQLMEQEVHEAYYAYQKARLTLEHARQKGAFRREQVKILRAQAELNEALPSQVFEAMLQGSDDEVSQVQAQATYHVALARLNKAIGVTSYY